ncbi:MAG: SDR family NAD(P)-dependent oxidoreductase [Okeania sp. SIO2G4]|uniref:SDR family NAD(P)-dependent oxidoreductase n=1 Tax=unclassified Okeania TaxID=2634635 RepID=UPI0013BA46D4|nr:MULTISPECIES: SDR family NAD(P)-dependent oxidoreductase [unclassified Okeania]NEP06877.1 SDR family NAD(P)-dependent oxidoreductase [Okeania sp. SIO4D6]NEP41591.1 SDR family NAD(P)-dependent oxidoreductase [Okeania sp. SIO2H7]NEP74983.1 SDR family NAD(P)-dependent oxidoreductase [Okeania sp. SIO2G5]NEP96663.1 SDR family NAD(P)-dependent oxidoreductase [Okeania sp. SIO2F5]NEQ93849.1 SDR family NAD(P)-dependent oxidoreductase [Okeania sp. SIO2G4]
MNQDLQNQVCIVTGGNSGVGLMTAVGLAKAGCHVFIACRSISKATKAVDYIRQISGNKNVEFLPLNLASLDSVRQFVDLFITRQLPLHILVNNAGIFNQRGTTQEGFELIWGTNYLGHFLLTYLLLEKLKSSAFSRIIMVASDLALKPKTIPWNLLVKKTPLNFLELYSVSKLCLLLLTTELARQLENTNVTVNAVHPGFVQSNITIWHSLSKYLGLGISPEKGANSTLFCAQSSQLKNISGKFFDSQNQEITLPKIATDIHLAKQLWERSLLWSGCQNTKTNETINYDNFSGISGPYTLKLDSQEIGQITKTIFAEILPKPPSKLLFLRLLKFLLKFKFGSAFLLLVQIWKQEFHMERHLDSPEIWKICQDEKLLAKLQEYLGEKLVLWRSELWVNYPAKQLIPLWHRDSYPKLLSGVGKTINVYIALTEVNKFNGFEFIPNAKKDRNLSVKMTDPFSGNNFFEVTEKLAENSVPVILKPGQFVMFTDELIHRSVCNTSGQVRLSLTLRVTQPSVEVLPNYNPNYQQSVLL